MNLETFDDSYSDGYSPSSSSSTIHSSDPTPLDEMPVPPPPLLVELLQNLGVSFSQLTPNALLYFIGFCHRVSAIDLVPSVELFHALFLARRFRPE